MALFDPAIFDAAVFDAGGGGTPTAYTLEVTPAVYSLTGSSSSLIARRLVGITPAIYALTGASASLLSADVLGITPGAYSLTGASVELVYTASAAAYSLEVTPGAYSVSGSNAGLNAARVLGVTPSSYAVSGADVELNYAAAPGAYSLEVLPGSYTLSGEPVALDYSGGAPVGGNGFVIVDTAPRLWWKRKPKALPEDEAEQQVKRVAGVIERIAREQVANPEPVSVQREQARQAVAPLVRDMPGFDWSAMYRAAIAALIQQRLEEQARLIAAQEIERIRLFEADEDDVLILLMAA